MEYLESHRNIVIARLDYIILNHDNGPCRKLLSRVFFRNQLNHLRTKIVPTSDPFRFHILPRDHIDRDNVLTTVLHLYHL